MVRSSYDQMEMYSGSKDGIVNVWNLVQQDQLGQEDESHQAVNSFSLHQVASLKSQGSSVTSITPLDPQYGKMIVYGSFDKSLRICKKNEDTESQSLNQSMDVYD